LQPGCNYGIVRPDALIVRDNNKYAGDIEELLFEGSKDPGFGAIFNNTEGGKLFSRNTVRLERFEGNAQSYLGPMQQVLDEYRRNVQTQTDSASEIAAVTADLVCTGPAVRFLT
jgi:hypothetical protein